MKVFRLLLYVYIRLTLSFAAALTSDFLYSLKPRAAIIEWTGGTRPPTFWFGGRKGKCPPTDCPFSKIFRTYFPFG